MTRTIVIMLFIAVWASACAAPSPATNTPASPDITPLAPAAEATAEPSAEPTAAPLGPQRVTFNLADGTEIVGTFYPPSLAPAPGVLLAHQRGMDRRAWEPLIQGLQGQLSRSASTAGDSKPNYAVFAIDLPGHGESGGQWTDAGGLEATRLALQLFRAMGGVDSERMVIIGASIGADAAVDECKEGCVGAVSLSPGSFLGVDYNTALAALGDRPVLCVASKEDGPSAATCEGGKSVGLKNYQVQIYDGALHGNYLILQNAEVGPAPQPLPLILEWLAINVPLK